MKKILKNFKIFVIIILILILAKVTFEKFILKKDIISIFNKSFLVVISGSMEPTIYPKELIIIDKQKNYKVGDIVTYKDDEKNIITHRIISLNNKNFIAKGDNNNINDDEQEIKNIYGKVIVHSKILGLFVLYILKPMLLIYLIYIVIVEIYNLNKEKKYETQN